MIRIKTASRAELTFAQDVTFDEFKLQIAKITGVAPQNQILLVYPKVLLDFNTFGQVCNEYDCADDEAENTVFCLKKKIWLVEKQTSESLSVAHGPFFVHTPGDALRFLLSTNAATGQAHIASLLNAVSSACFLREYQETLLCSKMQQSSICSLAAPSQKEHVDAIEIQTCAMCSKRIHKFSIKCPACRNVFCCRHRLPEVHLCSAATHSTRN